jgi:hypothetical protein
VGRRGAHLQCAPTPTSRTTRSRGRDFGAEGIGLCRTEHMFFEGDKIDAVREMILAETTGEPKKALARLLPLQRATSRRCSSRWRAPGDHPLARPAAARVPAARGEAIEALAGRWASRPNACRQDRALQ